MLPALVRLKQCPPTSCGYNATREFKWPCGLIVYDDEGGDDAAIIVTSVKMGMGVLRTVDNKHRDLGTKVYNLFYALKDKDEPGPTLYTYQLNGFLSVDDTIKRLDMFHCPLHTPDGEKLDRALDGLRQAIVPYKLGLFRSY